MGSPKSKTKVEEQPSKSDLLIFNQRKVNPPITTLQLQLTFIQIFPNCKLKKGS